jgi:spoIIIJ-associated protein
MSETKGIQVEGETFDEAVITAAAQLGLKPGDLAVEIVDPGSSANSSLGFRPVKVRAWLRDSNTAPDGARKAGPGGPRRSSYGEGDRRPSRGGGTGGGLRRGPAPVSYGPPPPPLDPERITPVLVDEVRGMTEGILAAMEFPSSVLAEKTKHGIRVAVDAGERDQFLIGEDGETLAALQHLLGRMIRASHPDDPPPRLEVDVAGFRDRQIERLRELARDLMNEARQSGGEVTTDPLPANERRIVHLEVAEAPGMETVTIGDGYFKRVVVRQAQGVRDEARGS